MYIEIHNYEEMEQDILYFKLTNAFNMDNMEKMNKKIAGIYAIYKDDRCVYVGQSINLASRIATHLRGKYEVATSIFCWDMESIYNDSQYAKRGKERKQNMLDNAEKYVMSKLKPIENLNIDMDFKLPEDEVIYFHLDIDADITIGTQKGGRGLYVTNNECCAYDDLRIGIEYAHYEKELTDEVRKEIFKRSNDNRLISFQEITGSKKREVFSMDVAI